MTTTPLPFFGQALQAGQTYVKASVRARDAQYRFLALTYLAYREGQQHSQAFQKMIHSRLNRVPTAPETKRPFLLLLHALIGPEDECPPNTLPQFSKLTSALEEIDLAFKDADPNTEDLTEFIQDSGGVGGLYDLSRVGRSDESSEPPASTHMIMGLKPTDIALPQLGICVTKVGRGYRMRMIDRNPGEYRVRLRIGQGGFIEAILDEELNQNAA